MKIKICYELVNLTGYTKVRVTRYDEDRDSYFFGKPIKFPTGTPIWSFGSTHPDRGKSQTNLLGAQCAMAMVPDPAIPPIAVAQGYSNIYKGAFMLNERTVVGPPLSVACGNAWLTCSANAADTIAVQACDDAKVACETNPALAASSVASMCANNFYTCYLPCFSGPNSGREVLDPVCAAACDATMTSCEASIPVPNAGCWDTATELLTHGVTSESCAQYYYRGDGIGMGIRFVPMNNCGGL